MINDIYLHCTSLLLNIGCVWTEQTYQLRTANIIQAMSRMISLEWVNITLQVLLSYQQEQ